MVVMKPCSKPQWSSTTFTTGTRQFVVQDAFEMARCLDAASRSVNRPVLSSTTSTPRSFHGSCCGSLMAETAIGLPFTTSVSPWGSHGAGKRPWDEAYFGGVGGG